MPKYNKQRKAAVDAMVKEDICKAVSRILSEDRPESLTMELVAQEAGMAKGTLYNYFKNKAELIAYVIVGITKPDEEKAEKIVLSNVPVTEKLLTIAKCNMKSCSEYGELLSTMAECAAQAFSQSFVQDEAQASRIRGEKRITKIIKEGQQTGILKDIPADDLVMAYSGVVEWFTKRRLGRKKNRSIDKDAAMVMEIFMGGAST